MSEKETAGNAPEISKSKLNDALGYIPETPWMVEGNLVYNLKWTGGWHKGEKQMCNDVAVHIDARLAKTVVADVANAICTALNRQYWNK